MLPGLPFIFRLFRIPSPHRPPPSPLPSPSAGSSGPVHGMPHGRMFQLTRSWNTGSQNTQPVCCVSPSVNGERVLLKSTMTREASQESQLSWDTCTLWRARRNAPPRCICCKPCATWTEVGSKTRTPVSHSTHWPMPRGVEGVLAGRVGALITAHPWQK